MPTKRNAKTAYTDGAASGNPGPAGWAVLIDGEIESGWLPRQTNNQMELFAIYQAVEMCPPNTDLDVVTDSKLAIGWLGKNYKMTQPAIAETVRMIKDTCRIKGMTLSLIKTKGHADDALNNQVDQQARLMTKLAKAYA